MEESQAFSNDGYPLLYLVISPLLEHELGEWGIPLFSPLSTIPLHSQTPHAEQNSQDDTSSSASASPNRTSSTSKHAPRLGLPLRPRDLVPPQIHTGTAATVKNGSLLDAIHNWLSLVTVEIE